VAKDGALTPLEWNGMIATPKSGKPGFESLKLDFGLYAKYLVKHIIAKNYF